MLDSAAASSSDVRFRTPTSGLLRWSLAALMLGFVVFSWVAPGAADTPSERIFGPLVLLLLAAVFLSMGVTVRADRTRLLLVHTLFYRRALARDEIATVTAATWRPISFGGWGVKGWAATTKGLLLNASFGHRGDQGLRIVTTDGRTYSVEVPDPVVAAARVRELLDVPEAAAATR
jgi:hypothetical protein